MSLETLLEAARYVEQLENKARAAAAAAAAATASAPDHSHAVAPHSNHHNSAEPRGAKLKRERAEQDDLFCEEKMLIIDEEEPLENHSRANGNLQQQLHHQTQPQTQPQQQHHLSSHYGHQQHLGGGARGGGGISPSVGNSPPSTGGQQQQHHLVGLTASQHEHEAPTATQHNHYFDSHNSNHSQSSATGGTLIVDVETVTDSKKTRNGPCVIRSGTREVHNKLEKNRRAHLKECFELLKKQLPSQEEKKSSNLSILHAAIRHIQALRRKEREYEHEMERLAREKITAQQRIVSLKKELAATWDHIDFSTLLPEYNTTIEPTPKNASESMEVDMPSGGLARGGTRYSSTSSLSSAATANSPQNLQTSSGGGGAAGSNVNSNLHSQAATAAVVCQTQGLNLAQNSRESPPTSSSPGASNPSIPTPAQEKVTISPTIVQQTQQQAPAQLHLPISAQMLNTGQGLATIMPTLQHLGSGLRVIPSDGRQLIAVQSNGSVAGTANGDARPVALVVHSTTASNDNRVTFVHSTSGDRPLALAVQSSCSDVRPVAFVSGNEARPIVLATTHASAINVNNTQTRIRTADATQATHKMVGGVTLVGGTGSELARLPGGAELNILPANGVFRSVKAQPLAVQGGLTLSQTSVSLQPSNKSGTTTQTTTSQHQQTVNNNNSNNNNHSSPVTSQHNHEGLAASCHLVASGQQPLAGLTPIVGPMTVMSQGNNQVILAPSSLAGKMIGTPLLKSVGQGHLPLAVNAAQYLNSLVKPVVVVSNSHQQAQQQSQQQQQRTTNNGVTVSSQSAV